MGNDNSEDEILAAVSKGDMDFEEASDLLFGPKSFGHLNRLIRKTESLLQEDSTGEATSSPKKPEPPESSPKTEQPTKPPISLEELIGQEAAKNSIEKIIAVAKVNKARIERDMKPFSLTYHAIFSGSPGTGKTTFARYYAQEIKKLGLLDNGHLVEVARQDLIAEYQGATAKKTMDVIKSARGGILFIDEAYALKHSKQDNYGQECIDALVKGIEDHRDDLIVILAGYTEEMRNFLHLNPGLKSRIPNQIDFEDFSPDELLAIFKVMYEKQELTVEHMAQSLVAERLMKGKKGKSFGNAREVRNILESALAQQSVRLAKKDLAKLEKATLCELIYSDFTDDPGDEGTYEDLHHLHHKDQASAMAELEVLVGLKEIKAEMKRMRDYIRVTKARLGHDASLNINAHMIFRGNPGTGKTTVARLIGNLFKEIGLLPSGHVVEVDRSHFIGEYQGQTAVKAKDCIERALGGILFIDEAYSLYKNARDDYGIEAITILLKSMEDYKGRFVVILAGYDEPMNTFLTTNPGLASRFGKDLTFPDFEDSELGEIGSMMAREQNFTVEPSALEKMVQAARQLPSKHFANAREIRNQLESAVKHHAERMVSLGDLKSIDKETLNTITSKDVK